MHVTRLLWRSARHHPSDAIVHLTPLGGLLFLVSCSLSALSGQTTATGCCPASLRIEGDARHRSVPPQIVTAGSDNPALFADEVAGPSFSLTAPGLESGRYTIEVDLAETELHDEGQRLMNVDCGRTNIARNFDIFKVTGGFARAGRIAGAADYTDGSRGNGFSIRFTGRKGAVFNAVRIKNVRGQIVASLAAAELRDMDPPGADRAPDVKSPPIYRDPDRPLERRVDDLIRRMSLREKVGQLMNAAPAIDRLGVPAYDYWNECLHGVARAGVATGFPQVIGLAAAWDPAMLHTIADVIATEARAKYHDAIRRGVHARYYGLTFWTPNINLFRDPRWGRGQETYGEDPFLTGRLAVAFITGLQGDDPHYLKALACAKHFAVHSGPESLRHTFDARPPERDFYDSYLPHFEAAVREGHVGTVMGAYNRVYGMPATASPLLLTDLLRRQWGFTGHVVSDCGAIEDIWAHHKVVATPEEAAARAIKAGCDIECGAQYYALTRAVKQGLVTEIDLDRALRRVFGSRFQLGMFDPDGCVPYASIPMSEVDSPAHAALALRAARESLVLLKNDGLLPLDRAKLRRIAVIGANAAEADALRGNYPSTFSHPVTILQGIKDAAGPGLEVVSAQGCPLAIRPGEKIDKRSPDFLRALAVASDADVVVYVGGLNVQLEDEQMSVNFDGFEGGDRTRIELPAVQSALLRALHGLGKRIVFVNCSGSAMAMPWEAANLPAILEAWYPGEAGGTAVADVLFGNYNPAGRLPVTFYRATTDLPPFEDYSMANRTYRYFTGRPLFAFGHGLSYTRFEYGPAHVADSTVAATGTIHLRLDLVNTGPRNGDEVVQVYARPIDPTDALGPHQRLCAFQRVSVAKGATTAVDLTIPVQELRHWDTHTKSYVVDPGAYQLEVGAASDDIRVTTVVRVTARL